MSYDGLARAHRTSRPLMSICVAMSLAGCATVTTPPRLAYEPTPTPPPLRFAVAEPPAVFVETLADRRGVDKALIGKWGGHSMVLPVPLVVEVKEALTSELQRMGLNVVLAPTEKAARLEGEVNAYGFDFPLVGEWNSTITVGLRLFAPGQGTPMWEATLEGMGHATLGWTSRVDHMAARVAAAAVSDATRKLRSAPGFVGTLTRLSGASAVAARDEPRSRPLPSAQPLEGRQLAPGQTEFGRYHALVIGNEAYRHLPLLKTPVADAKAVADLLRLDYGFENVTLLTNATRAEIIRALDYQRRTLSENDNLLVYYAGHGYLDKDVDRGYWLPIDAETDNTANWLPNTDVTDKLRGLRAKHVLVIADSCYSGTLVRDVAIRSLAPLDLERLAQKRARTAITSGGLEPVSDVGGGAHSVFARAFIGALKSVEGVVDTTSLFGAIRRQVLLQAEQTPQYSDIRQAGHEGGDFLFVRRR